MKVRIGVGISGSQLSLPQIGRLVDDIDRFGFDSLWLSEVLTAQVIDPLVGLSWAAGRNQKIKLGTTMLLPGRNVVRIAKELATLDMLSGGRLLVTFVPGLTAGPEMEAIGVPPKRRSAHIDEVMPVLRRLWAGETVTHHGEAASFSDVTLSPLPVQQPLEMWLGGNTPAALERCGRLSDGWLPALCTPDEAAAGKVVIDEAAARAGRAISPEHFGVSIGYSHTPLEGPMAAAIAARARGHDPSEVMPVGLPALRDLMERFLDVGFSKFVVRPSVPPDRLPEEMESLAKAVADLQT
jgi:probable F420-dependent oxidoreductase